LRKRRPRRPILVSALPRIEYLLPSSSLIHVGSDHRFPSSTPLCTSLPFALEKKSITSFFVGKLFASSLRRLPVKLGIDTKTLFFPHHLDTLSRDLDAPCVALLLFVVLRPLPLGPQHRFVLPLRFFSSSWSSVRFCQRSYQRRDALMLPGPTTRTVSR